MAKFASTKKVQSKKISLKYPFPVLRQKRTFSRDILNKHIFREAYLFYFLCDYDTSKLTSNK